MTSSFSHLAQLEIVLNFNADTLQKTKNPLFEISNFAPNYNPFFQDFPTSSLKIFFESVIVHCLKEFLITGNKEKQFKTFFLFFTSIGSSQIFFPF